MGMTVRMKKTAFKIGDNISKVTSDKGLYFEYRRNSKSQ